MISTWPFWIVLLVGAGWTAWGSARWREPVLAALAAVLIGWTDLKLLLIYFCLVAAVWQLVSHGRISWAKVSAIIALAAGLVIFKWGQAVQEGFAGALGFSYLIFKLIHVLIEAGRGQLPPIKGLSEFTHYMLSPAMFVAGPLERFEHFVGEKRSHLDGTLAAEALQRIALGLVKKLLLADAVLVNLSIACGVENNAAFTPETPAATLWWGAFFCYMRIYAEFSGYSDIAVGAGLLWGRRIMENFNWPILAVTLPDFWRRWHISLSQWCSRYIYMPAIGKLRTPLVPMFGSFLVMGLWHIFGWNRVGWAIYQTAGVLVYLGWCGWMGRAKPNTWRMHWPWRVVSCLLTQAFVTVGYVFLFRGENVSIQSTLAILARMFGLG